MPAEWFTLVRFRGDPQHLTGVSEARTAREALDQCMAWEERYPGDTVIVFAPDQQPIIRAQLEFLAAGLHPPRSD